MTRSLRALGIRMALGAQRRDVLWGVIRGALLVASIGIVVGLLATLLVVTTVVAACIPARRASQIDPVFVLRAE